MNQEIENNNIDYLEKIQVLREDTTWFYKALKDKKKRIWIFAYDLDDIISRFTGKPSKDIENAYKKYYKIDISDYSIHFLLSKEELIKKIIPEITSYPIIFSTEGQKFKIPIILKDIDMYSI